MGKFLHYLILAILILALRPVVAQNNSQLQKMADEDQNSRMSSEPIDWKVLRNDDSIRRVKVIALLENKEIRTGKDFLNAGIIFQHGIDTSASKMAVEFFEKAIELDSTLNKWWYAAAVDRNLMRKGEPQIFGTQYIMSPDNNGNPTPVQYKLDTAKISDKERKYYGVPTLAEQKQRNQYLKLKTIGQFYYSNKSINKTIDLINEEFSKGENAEYDVREDSINRFGYALMNSNQNEEALIIFKLNTKLFPHSANAYDSYGECLLRIGDKEKAFEAYNKSLKLDPNNENARKILSQDD